MIKCTQCDKPAIVALGGNPGHPLCVEHYKLWQDAVSKQNEDYERAINMLEAHMYDTVGLPRPEPSFPPRKHPIVVQDKRTQNMIHIDRSVIGSVNTGTIDNLEVSMNNINNSNAELAQAIKKFTEAIGKESGLSSDQKQELIDQLSAFTREADLPKDKRRPGVIKALGGAIKSSVETYGTLSGLWQIIQTLMRIL